MHLSKRGESQIGVCLAFCLLGGCEKPVTTVSFHQPHVRGRQQNLDLATAQTYFADDAGVERVLAELPLPGAWTGDPIFLLYLRVNPAPLMPSKDSSPTYEVRGFLIQTR